MRYYLIAGEPSGDMHAANLMHSLKAQDPHADFRYYGGDKMQAEGGTLVRHYRDTAVMGFINVLTHLPAILRNIKHCKADIAAYKPDVVILVDYPGFNLKIAKFVKTQLGLPVYYYIPPKIWAWKEGRIKQIKKYINRIYAIFPFEVDFFEKKHHYPISYVGNPTVDEISQFRAAYKDTFEIFCQQNHLNPQRPFIALLAGSRKQEIKDNLCMMCEAAAPYVEQGYQLVLAGAPSITQEYYDQTLKRLNWSADRLPRILRSQTYPLLSHATAALVTSGTAALETGLFRVPQVVCYGGNEISYQIARMVVKLKYISLANLIMDKGLFKELIQHSCTPSLISQELEQLLHNKEYRARMMQDYADVRTVLGGAGASAKVAKAMTDELKKMTNK